VEPGRTACPKEHRDDVLRPWHEWLGYDLHDHRESRSIDAAVNELTSGWTDDVTSCPEYKVTAVSVQPA
jgi:hypothetical protein